MKQLAPLVLISIGACLGPVPEGPGKSDSSAAGGDDGGFGGTTDGGAGDDVAAGGGADAGAGAPPGSAPRPFVTAANPPLDAEEVYPAPLWSGNGEEVVVELSFSSPMTRQRDFDLDASDHVRPLEATWSSDATMLRLVARPDFAFPHALAEATEYSLDVSALLSAEGAQLEPDTALRNGRLVFSTGRLDELLNHSCGHTFFGPFASVGSATSPAAAPDISATHTQYSVALNEDETGYAGWVRANFATSGQYRFYFDGLVKLLVGADGTGRTEALEPTTTPRACPGISHETTFQAAAGAELFLRVEGSADRIRRIIVELVPDGAIASP